MGVVKRIYVEKKAPFAVKAKELKEDLVGYLGMSQITDVRELIRYDVENVSDEVFEKACKTVFSEPPVDDFYLDGRMWKTFPRKCLKRLVIRYFQNLLLIY